MYISTYSRSNYQELGYNLQKTHFKHQRDRTTILEYCLSYRCKVIDAKRAALVLTGVDMVNSHWGWRHILQQILHHFCHNYVTTEPLHALLLSGFVFWNLYGIQLPTQSSEIALPWCLSVAEQNPSLAYGIFLNIFFLLLALVYCTLAKYGNKTPQIGRLKQQKFTFSVLEIRSPRSKCLQS